MNKIIKFIKKKGWQIGYIANRLFWETYYGIKWLILYTPKDPYISTGKFDNYPEFDKIIKIIDEVRYNPENKVIQRIGTLECPLLSEVTLTKKQKLKRIKDIFDIDFETMMNDCEKLNDIKLTKKDRNTVLANFDPNNPISIKDTVVELKFGENK